MELLCARNKEKLLLIISVSSFLLHLIINSTEMMGIKSHIEVEVELRAKCQLKKDDKGMHNKDE